MRSWLIVGLGNPGEKYERTRHNLGFMLVDLMASQLGIKLSGYECRSIIGNTLVEGIEIELAKPQTFMNLSGEAVSCLLRKGYRSVEKMIVVVDDLALPLGKIRIRSKGSSGGHNGLKSIIECLGTEKFIRLRIGIQPEHEVEDLASFVLQDFSEREVEIVDEVLQRSAEAVHMIINEGLEKAMAKFN